MPRRAATAAPRPRSGASRTQRPTPPKIGEMMRAIRALVNALGQSARSIELRTGITNAQLFLLQQLERTDGLSINELAALALTKQSTVSIVVGRLARGGLVRRARSRDDRRRVCVSLTARGRRLLTAAPEPPTSRVIAALHELSPAQLDGLAAGLAGLAQALGARGGEPMMLFEERAGAAGAVPRPRAAARARR